MRILKIILHSLGLYTCVNYYERILPDYIFHDPQEATDHDFGLLNKIVIDTPYKEYVIKSDRIEIKQYKNTMNMSSVKKTQVVFRDGQYIKSFKCDRIISIIVHLNNKEQYEIEMPNKCPNLIISIDAPKSKVAYIVDKVEQSFKTVYNKIHYSIYFQ